jgi:hypothetical protein
MLGFFMTKKLIKKQYGSQEEFISENCADYIHFIAGRREVTLDGVFNVDDLEMIVSEMKCHLTPLAHRPKKRTYERKTSI